MYFLWSDKADQPSVGVTSNVARRLDTHNGGGSVFAASGRPWRLAAAIGFQAGQRALDFEQCLKSDSGRAVARRHVL